MGTSTANLQLYKPDPTEMVDVALHVNANYDRLENKLVTTSSGPGCVLRRDTNFTVPNAVDTAISWTVSERNDSVGGLPMWAPGATDITIRKAGIYTCGVRGVFAAGAGTSRGLYVAIPGIVVIDYDTKSNASYYVGTTMRVGAPRNFNVGDVIRAVAVQDSGVGLDLVSNTDLSGGKLRFWVIWEQPFIGS